MHEVDIDILAIELFEAVLECLADTVVRSDVELGLNDEFRARNPGFLGCNMSVRAMQLYPNVLERAISS